MVSPYDLSDVASYLHWRDLKIENHPQYIDDLRLKLNADDLSVDMQKNIEQNLQRTNLVIYELLGDSSDIRQSLLRLAGQIGLHRIDGNLCSDEDAISSISDSGTRSKGEYIPYTNKKLNWHTDGYYNAPKQQIRSIVMHCVNPASEGGENAFLDHEVAYILLRDQDPAYIKALMAPDVFRIPANIQNGVVIRPEFSGPVFSVDSSGFLHMRFSARTKNIVWKNDITTRKAVDFLLNLLDSTSPYILRYRLKSNEGIISNNVLHNRSAFADAEDTKPGRLLLRARYYDRVTVPK